MAAANMTQEEIDILMQNINTGVPEIDIPVYKPKLPVIWNTNEYFYIHQFTGDLIFRRVWYAYNRPREKWIKFGWSEKLIWRKE